MKDLNIQDSRCELVTNDIFVLIYVHKDAILLFVCLFVCYLFPAADPKRFDIDMMGNRLIGIDRSGDLKTQTLGSPVAQVGASHSIVSVSDWFNFGFIYSWNCFSKLTKQVEITKEQKITRYAKTKILFRICAKQLCASMRNYIEISCNFYSKLKKIFAQLLYNFRANNFDWKPYLKITLTASLWAVLLLIAKLPGQITGPGPTCLLKGGI